MPRLGRLVLVSALALSSPVHADEGSAFVAGLFGHHGPAASTAAVLKASDSLAPRSVMQDLALKRVGGADDLSGFKNSLDSRLLPHSMLGSNVVTANERYFTDLRPSKHSIVPRVSRHSFNSLQEAISAFKKDDAADEAEDESFNVPVLPEGDAAVEASEVEAAKKKKEWIMLQEILKLQSLLKEEKEEKEEREKWVQEQKIRNEEWALKEVANAEISHIKKLAAKRVTKAEVIANKAVAAQHFTTEATAIRTAIDHLRMHKAMDAVNKRYVAKVWVYRGGSYAVILKGGCLAG
jgi:hypothetical protein